MLDDVNSRIYQSHVYMEAMLSILTGSSIYLSTTLAGNLEPHIVPEDGKGSSWSEKRYHTKQRALDETEPRVHLPARTGRY